MKEEMKEHYKYRLKWIIKDLKNTLEQAPLNMLTSEQKITLATTYTERLYDLYLQLGFSDKLKEIEQYREKQRKEELIGIEASENIIINATKIINNIAGE